MIGMGSEKQFKGWLFILGNKSQALGRKVAKQDSEKERVEYEMQREPGIGRAGDW